MSFSTEVNQFVKDYTIKNASKINKMIAPLKSILSVDAFWYNFISHDGRFFSLGSHERLIDYFFSHDLWKTNPVIRHPKFFRNSFIFMDRALDDPDFQMIQNKINEKCCIYPILSSFEKDTLGVHTFGFGTSHNKSLIHLFLNNLGLVKNFIAFFRKEASLLIEESYKNSIDISSPCGDYFYADTHLDKEMQCIAKAEEMLSEHYKNDLGVLSKREKECLFWLIHGKTGKEIAEKLSLSPRTVESYLEHCKNKLGCYTKSELFEKALTAKELGFLL